MSGAKKVGLVLIAAGIAAPVVANFEGVRKFFYRDAVGIPTVCYGHTENVQPGKRYSDEECLELLAQDLVQHGLELDRCIKVPIRDETRAALVSWAFNVGVTAACQSSLMKKLNAGDLRGACAELDRWVFAGGQKLPGLVRRRAAEREMCERGVA